MVIRNLNLRLFIVYLTSFCQIFLPISYPVANAQIVLEVPLGSGNRPYFDYTNNNTPKVNITTPNNSGISHNRYKSFNVDSRGLILNNSAVNANTRLAGWVEGNPNLRIGKEASVIFNEVTGISNSKLNGFMEVAGKKANVVVANENGITCSGCGFINTDRITLTTGIPVWNSLGGLDSFLVDKGSIEVTGEGIIGSDQKIDLLSQYINIKARVDAKELNAISGNNQIDYDELTFSRISDASGLAGIDSSALGGMYADQIRLIATGDGVGVRLAGDLIGSGNVEIESDGTLVNQQTISAGEDLSIKSKTIQNQLNIIAGGELALSGEELSNSGEISGEKSATINFTQSITNQGEIDLEQELTITDGQLNNSGDIRTNAELTIDNTGFINSSTMQSKGAFTLDTEEFSNSGDILSLSTLSFDSIAAINNAGGMIASLGNIQITTQAGLDNADGLILHLGDSQAEIEAAGLVNNSEGKIESKGSKLVIDAGQINNNDGEIYLSGSYSDPSNALLEITATKSSGDGQSGEISNIEGTISSNGQIEIEAYGYLTTDDPQTLNAGDNQLTFLDESDASSAASASGTSNLYDASGDLELAVEAEDANEQLESANEQEEQAQ